MSRLIPVENIKASIHKASLDGYESICLCGDDPINFIDPLDREDLFGILEYAGHEHIRRIKLYTTLHSIESVKKVDELANHGAMFYQVPLFGHKAEIHDAVAGKDNFNKTIRGMDTIKNTKVKYTHWSPFLHIDIILDNKNYAVVKDIILCAVNKKADIIYVSASFSGFSFSDIIPPLTEVIDTALQNRSWIMIKDIPPCLLPGFEYFLYELYEKDAFADKKIKMNVCNECIYNTVCNGVKEDYIRAYTEKEFSPVTHSTLDIKAIEEIKKNQETPQI